MHTDYCQRWLDKRETYRQANEPNYIRTAEYDVALITEDKTARAFVTQHHYAGTYPAARFRFGLFHQKAGLVGVAVFSHPCNGKALTNVFGGTEQDSV